VFQETGEGTGAAILAARDATLHADRVLIHSADQPLVPADVIEGLLAAHVSNGGAATVLTADAEDPSGYGRIVRSRDGRVSRIVETKHPEDVDEDTLKLSEINVGTYVFEREALYSALVAVKVERGEVYLPDVFRILREKGCDISAHKTSDATAALGVNTRVDLMKVERIARQRLIERHALNGVTFVSPETTVVDVSVEIGADTTIEAGVTLKGKTRIGSGVTISNAVIVDAVVEDGASIGPFAYLRPGTVVGEGAKIGTFVELKNSRIGPGAKVPHLSYLGDADVGEDANIAAGNVTANYDGFKKSRTKIGKRAKTGVNNSFVAPVTVGDDAYTGAGSVINQDVPDGALGISYPKGAQTNIEGYADRAKKRKGS